MYNRSTVFQTYKIKPDLGLLPILWGYIAWYIFPKLANAVILYIYNSF
jgi:hypothetical protein